MNSVTQLPDEWIMAPLDYLADVHVSSVDKKFYPNESIVRVCNYTDVYYNDSITSDLPFLQASASPEQVARSSIRGGDVVITKDSENSDDIGRPAYVPRDIPGAVYGYHLAIYRPRRPEYGKYLRYVFDSAAVRREFDVRTPGVTRVGLSQNTLRHVRVPLPPPTEAWAIADYLDHETAEIDEFIADQERMRDLTDERWKSELVHLIQTGAAHSSHVEPTGISTWPLAPRAWRRTRLKATVQSDQNGSWGGEPGDDEMTVRCIRVADFDKQHARVHDANVTRRAYASRTVRTLGLTHGDLIIEKSGGGPSSPVGNVVLYDGPGGDMYSNFTARIRSADQVNSLYAVYLHKSLYLSRVTSRSVKQSTGIQNLDMTSYLNEPIFLPSAEEQVSIANHVEAARRNLDALTNDIELSVNLARERRAALISAAVTGQIDVTQKHKPVAEQLEDEVKQLS